MNITFLQARDISKTTGTFSHEGDGVPKSDVPWCGATEGLSNSLERMIQIQMTAFPESWPEEDRREMAERELFGASKEQDDGE